MKRKEPVPNRDEGLEKFIIARIKYLKLLKGREDMNKKQKRQLKECILNYRFLLHEWRKVKK